ncbi:hypothetical protein HOH87_05900 [bacterium]|jgi:hypothetical protein|nr:hypothetical protein [bacterium]
MALGTGGFSNGSGRIVVEREPNLIKSDWKGLQEYGAKYLEETPIEVLRLRVNDRGLLGTDNSRRLYVHLVMNYSLGKSLTHHETQFVYDQLKSPMTKQGLLSSQEKTFLVDLLKPKLETNKLLSPAEKVFIDDQTKGDNNLQELVDQYASNLKDADRMICRDLLDHASESNPLDERECWNVSSVLNSRLSDGQELTAKEKAFLYFELIEKPSKSLTSVQQKFVDQMVAIMSEPVTK